MAQVGFFFNMDNCIGCNSCAAACKTTWDQPPHVRWRRVYTFEGGEYPTGMRVFQSIACNHCVTPTCLTSCPAQAYTKREKDGVVILNTEQCIGCKYCLWTCPYGAPQFDEKTGKVSKCHMCYPRLDEGKQPACVEACLSQALYWGDIDQFAARFRQVKRDVDGFPDPEITKPAIRFEIPAKLPEKLTRVLTSEIARTKGGKQK